MEYTEALELDHLVNYVRTLKKQNFTTSKELVMENMLDEPVTFVLKASPVYSKKSTIQL